jgi:Reverse transcriptase (RNA-dependent DNA polymerase)
MWGLDEWVVNVVKSMYSGATTTVKMKNETSHEFGVKMGVHQGSVLSPLLFNIVLEALSRKFRQGLPWELLYADDLVLWAESEEELRAMIVKWKSGLESKGLQVNLEKTRVIRCRVDTRQVKKSSVNYPSGVCGEGVGANSIKCIGCLKWIHGSGLAGKLQNVNQSVYLCPMCVGEKSVSGKEDSDFILSGTDKLEVVDKFCKLEDTFGKAGGAEEASRNRVRCALGNFQEVAPSLTMRGASLKLKGIYIELAFRV